MSQRGGDARRNLGTWIVDAASYGALDNVPAERFPEEPCKRHRRRTAYKWIAICRHIEEKTEVFRLVSQTCCFGRPPAVVSSTGDEIQLQFGSFIGCDGVYREGQTRCGPSDVTFTIERVTPVCTSLGSKIRDNRLQLREHLLRYTSTLGQQDFKCAALRSRPHRVVGERFKQGRPLGDRRMGRIEQGEVVARVSASERPATAMRIYDLFPDQIGYVTDYLSRGIL